MSLLSKFLSSSEKKIEESPESPHADYAPTWGYRTESNERVSVDSARSIATAYRAANIISDDVAKLPFQMIKRNGRDIEQVQPDPVTRNMAYLLQVSPNMWGWSPFHFKKAAMDWLLWYGNAYLWMPVTSPRQILILPAYRTTPVFDMDGNVWYRHTFSNGKTSYIPDVEVLHLMINPDDTGMIGRGVITFARETFGKELAAYKTQAKLFANGFMPAAYIKVDGELNAEAREKMRQAYEEQVSSSENAYRLAIFDKKITDFQPINIQLKDAQFLKSIEATDKDIANFFGLPEHMLNRGKESYNSNEQKYIEYLQGTLDAFLVPWEEAARIRWLTRQEQINTYFKFNRDALLRMDAKTRAETNAARIRTGQINPNQAREKEDWSAYEGGDQYYMEGNLNPIGGGIDEQA